MMIVAIVITVSTAGSSSCCVGFIVRKMADPEVTAALVSTVVVKQQLRTWLLASKLDGFLVTEA
jgi:hypothetical protein